MTTINKITDGVGTSYDLAVRADNIQPIAEKSWTGLIASANSSSGNGSDFILGEFNIVIGTNWVLEVEIEADYTATDWSSNKAASHHICHVEGYSNATNSYSMWNNIRSTTYRPFYYFVVYRPSTATNKFYFGICLYGCNKNTDANNKRNVTCRVRLAQNLTNVALHDAPANTDYTTYYVSMASRSAYDCYNNGLRETGDDNSTTNLPSYDHVAWCTTGAGTAAKAASFSYFDYVGSKVFKMYVNEANTASTPTLNVNGQGAKPIYLLTGDNVWSVADATNKTITKGIHWVYWNGSDKFHILPDTVNSTAYTNDFAFLQGQASYATKNVFVHSTVTLPGVPTRIRVITANTNAGDLSLNINNVGAKPLFINGKRANGTSNNLTAGMFVFVYDGTNYNLYSPGNSIVYPDSGRAQKLHSLTIDASDGNTHYYKFLTKGSTDRAKNSVIAFGMRDSGDANPAGFLYLRTSYYTGTTGAHMIRLSRYTSNTTYYPEMRAVTDSSSGITSVYVKIGVWGGAWFSYVNGHDNVTFMKEEITAEEWNALGSNIGVFLEASTSDITNAINALDVASVGGSGKYISAISESDGKISATASNLSDATVGASNSAKYGRFECVNMCWDLQTLVECKGWSQDTSVTDAYAISKAVERDEIIGSALHGWKPGRYRVRYSIYTNYQRNDTDSTEYLGTDFAIYFRKVNSSGSSTIKYLGKRIYGSASPTWMDVDEILNVNVTGYDLFYPFFQTKGASGSTGTTRVGTVKIKNLRVERINDDAISPFILGSNDTIDNLNGNSTLFRDFIIQSSSVPAGTFPSDWTARNAYLKVFGHANSQFQHLYYNDVTDYHYERYTSSGSPGSFVFTDWKKVYAEATSTYSSTGTQAVNGTAVASAINALDVTDTAVATQLVSAVSETDGRIAVTRRALVAADIPNLDASKITTGSLDYWRQEAYSLDYHRTSASGSGYDGKQWTKFAWKEVSNYATASVWSSCDGVFDVFRKSYGTDGITYIGELSLTSSWGHSAGTGYSLKTSGNKSAVWNSYINTTMCSKEGGGYNSGRVTVKVVCSDTTIEWWICNQLWDATVYLKPKFKFGFTGITSNATSGAVLKTVEEFTEYCDDKLVKTCEHGDATRTPMVCRAQHLETTSDYATYKELNFTSADITWADFIAGRDNTNSFCYKLFQNASFDTTNDTIRAIGRLLVNTEIMLELDVASNYPQYEIYAVRQVGYVKFSGAGRVRIFYFNRYGVIGSKFRFMGDVTGSLTGNVTGNVTGNLTGNADTATSASSVPELTNAEIDTIWTNNN